jgi:preprotein translocase subunit YajC
MQYHPWMFRAAHAGDLAFAASSPPGGGGSTAVLTQLLFFAAIFAIFWFLLIRPQQKQKREREQMLATLKRGDRVVTTGGLHGTVTSLDDHKVVLRVADQVRLEFDRSAVGRILEPQDDKSA